ncbi:hypothetical protein [Brevibacillus laterosporus]|uniref:hypothetical protein n=1 Tax=Brevibacillus laterosporus TaxID=1465 RepID=UPI0018CEFC2E|nr:hypothetical protein [Brevibacillus laterosporus]MBG9799529.1 hypothetical protein [Brevibacillus laterosporus]MED1909749.1 hypothetical protein [Brevibacillus laterosporus]
MTPVLLLDAIVRRLEQVVKEYTLETNAGTIKTPQICKGYLPPKKKPDEQEPDFPYIIVRLLNGSDTNDMSSVTVRMLFGTYAHDNEGFVDTLNIMERVRQSLNKHRLLEDKFRLEYPYEWTLYEEQPKPEWIGESISRWVIDQPYEEVDFNW